MHLNPHQTSNLPILPRARTDFRPASLGQTFFRLQIFVLHFFGREVFRRIFSYLFFRLYIFRSLILH